ncbi:hypothetical protein [Holospora elegans]|nr:hypothetical protein [Holospora elegans]
MVNNKPITPMGFNGSCDIIIIPSIIPSLGISDQGTKVLVKVLLWIMPLFINPREVKNE